MLVYIPLKRSRKAIAGFTLLVVLMSLGFSAFWIVQFHEVAVHSRIAMSQANHVHLSSITIVEIQLLGTWPYFNLFGSKSWNVLYQISGEFYPPGSGNILDVTQTPNGKYEYAQLHL